MPTTTTVRIDNIHVHLAAPAATDTAAAAGPTPPAAGYPWLGQGGHYICTLPAQFGLPARHLVLANAELEATTWGGRGTVCAGATSQTDGRANTAALLADDAQHPAAAWAAGYQMDGHSDFYLPSRFELFMCWLSVPNLFSKTSWYWSSSQYSALNAWCQDFECGYSHAYYKDVEFRARPVRSIQLQPFNA